METNFFASLLSFVLFGIGLFLCHLGDLKFCSPVGLVLLFATLHTIAAAIHQLRFSIAFRYQSLSKDTVLHQVVDYRFGPLLGERHVVFVVGPRIGM